VFHRLVNHNDDIRRLLEKGYAIAFDSNHLIVRDIPYLDAGGAPQLGAIVTNYVSLDGDRIAQQDHQIFFAGSVPYGLDGKPIPRLGGGVVTLALSDACTDVVVERSFSNKPVPSGAFVDFFEKIESYVTIISGPAMSRHNANPLTFRSVQTVPDSVFAFHDTMTSRARIGDLSQGLTEDVIAIIGLGGTGAYLLDFLVRTPAKEIRAFDLDLFHVHNSYRSPGRVNKGEFKKKKAHVYRHRYKNFRSGLSFISKYIDSQSVEEMEGVTFAFVCVDKGSSRSEIFDLLIAKGIPFIDVGMGLNRKGGPIDGLVRTTYYSPDEANERRDMGLAPTADDPEDIYKTNIQIGELNALNAALAVIRFKQLRGFYADEIPAFHLLFEIGAAKVQQYPTE